MIECLKSINFDDNPRSAMVWGIKFHVKQFTETVPNGLDLKISYNYRKDVARGAYTARWAI